MKRPFVLLHWIVLAVWLALLTAKAMLVFDVSWDTLAYHLPAAMGMWGLTTFQMNAALVDFLAGFPPLAHGLQGLLIAITGRPSSMNLLHAIGFAATCGILRYLFGGRLSIRWFITCCLATPVFIHHFATGYVDLWTGLGVTVAFAGFFRLRETRRGEHGSVGASSAGAAAVILVGIAWAVLSKMQAWPAAGFIAVAAFVTVVGHARAGLLSRRQVLVWTALAMVMLGAWPIRNTVTFNNPTYPIPPPLLSRFYATDGLSVESLRRGQEANTPGYLWDSSNAVKFVHSAFELSRLRSSTPMTWDVDGGEANGSPESHQRMGGWFVATFSLLLASVVYLGWRRRLDVHVAALLAVLIVTTAMTPQSHELRYWVFVPFSLAVVFARYADELGGLKAGMAAAALYVLSTAPPWPLDTRAPREWAPVPAREFWALATAKPRSSWTICWQAKDTVFWSGPTFREFPVVAAPQGDDRECLKPDDYRAGAVPVPPGEGLAAATPFFFDWVVNETGPVRFENRHASIMRGTKFEISGWAVDGPAGRPAAGVVVVIDGREFPATYGSDRQDVGKHFGNQVMAPSGFAVTLKGDDLAPGRHTLTIRVVSADGRGFYAPAETYVLEIR